MPPTYCDQHKDENLKIYCLDCKSAVCMMCYIKSHNGNKWSDVNEVAEEFRKQMTNDVDNVAVGYERCKEMLERLDKEREDLNEQITKAGIRISEKFVVICYFLVNVDVSSRVNDDLLLGFDRDDLRTAVRLKHS